MVTTMTLILHPVEYKGLSAYSVLQKKSFT
jgi:hypothetical protein